MKRLDKQSIQNLKVAESINIMRVDHGSDEYSYMVRVDRGERFAYLHSGNGDIMNYDSINTIRRSIKRIRPDLELSEI